MKTKIEKKKLVDVLTKNRETHRDIFLDAQKGYRIRLIAEFEKRLELAKNNKPVDTYLHLTPPVDQTKDYDRAIKMCEMSTDEVVELGEEDFTQFVMDQWDWTRQWKNSNSAYSNKVTADD